MTTINISAHIPVELSNKLEKVCKLEERSKSYYIKKSLEQYIHDLQKGIISKDSK